MSAVLGFDESPGAVRALTVATEMSAAFDKPLVLGRGAAAPGALGDEYATHQQAVREAGHLAPEHAVRVAEEPGVRATVELTDQKPAAALTDAAARHAARFIVVGTWGESPARGALPGSTPTSSCSCPASPPDPLPPIR